jgi:hypothetical protein
MSIFENSSSEFFKKTWVYTYCRAVELTPHIARKLKPNTNYFVLVGQWYWVVNDKPSGKVFKNALKLFSFDKYSPNSEMPFGELNDNNQYVYGARMSLGKKRKKWYFGTGSGTDPVFIITSFIKVKPPHNLKGVLYKNNSSTTKPNTISNKTKIIIEMLGDSAVPVDVKYFNSSGKARNILLVERDWNKKQRRYSVQGYLLPSATMQFLHSDGWSSMDNPENFNIYENEVSKIQKLLRVSVVQHQGEWDDDYAGVQMDENGNIFVEFSAIIKLGQLENSISSLGLQIEDIAYVDY